MSSQQRQREVAERKERGQRNISSMLQPGLLEKRQKNRDRERERNGEEVCDAVQTDRPLRNSGGCQKASRSWAAQCGSQSGPESYIIEWSHAVTQISGKINCSARVTGGQSREQLLYPRQTVAGGT